MKPIPLVAIVFSTALAGAPAAQSFAPLVGGHLPISEGGAAPPQFEDLLAADLDGDGASDLVALGMGDNFVCRNDRAGGLVAWQRLTPFGYYLRRGALADVDGDGDLDVLAGQGTTRPNAIAAGPVRQYENRAGTFVEVTQPRMPVGSWLCGALVAFDHDRDGDADLAMAVLQAQTTDLIVMDNDGHGNFTLANATRLPAGLPRLQATFLAATDLDRDGDLDLIAAHRSGSLFLRNDGSGRFANHTANLPATGNLFAVVDVDRDGDDDLLGSGACWLNNGNASAFTQRATGVPLDKDNVRIGDLDGDGRLDLITTRFEENLAVPQNDGLPHVRLGRADGTFVEQPAFMPAELRAERAAMSGNSHWVGSSPILVVDLDRDGRLDLVHGGWKADVSGNSWTIGLPPRVLLNRDGVELRDGSRRTVAMLDIQTYGLVAGDVDADGDADLILGQFPDRVLRNRGDGSFELGEVLPGAGGTRGGLLMDLDRDGDLDFLRTGFGPFFPGPAPSLLLRQGNGWTAGPFPSLPDPGVALAAGDVDGDRDIDLVVGCGFGYVPSATTRLLLNDGAAGFADATAGRLPPEPQNTMLAFLRDFDQDGDLDLIEAALIYPTDRLRLSLNDGNGVFTDVSAARLPAMPGPFYLAAVDIDHDGDVDLVMPGTTLANGGTGWFTVQANAMTPFQHVVDLDGSGTWTTIHADRGPAITIGSQVYGWNTDSINVAVPIDADGDGDLDVAVGGWIASIQPYNFNTVTGVLFNLNRQLFAPRLLRVGQPWVLSLQATSPGSLAIPVLGTAVLQPRVPLGPFGQLGVDPTTALVLPAIVAGTAPVPNELRLPVPADASLVGVPLHAQALIVPGAGLQDARLTGVVSDRITR